MLPLNSDIALPFPARILQVDFRAGTESGPASVVLSLIPMPEQNWTIQLRFTGVKDLSIAKMSADGIRCALFEVSRLDQSGRQASRFPDAAWMVGDFKTDAIAFFAMTAEVISIEKIGR